MATVILSDLKKALASDNASPMAIAVPLRRLQPLAQNSAEAELIATDDGVTTLLSVMHKHRGEPASQAMKLLLKLLCHMSILNRIVPTMGPAIFSRLYLLSQHDQTGILCPALSLLKILVEYAPNGYSLIDDAASAGPTPYGPVVQIFREGHIDESSAAAGFLQSVLRKAAGINHLDSLRAKLLAAGLGQALDHVDAQLTGPLSPSQTSLQEIVREIRSACFVDSETEAWQAEAVELPSSLNLGANVTALNAISHLAGVPALDEEQMKSALRQHLNTMDEQLQTLSTSQQEAAARLWEEQRVQIESQLQQQKAMFETQIQQLRTSIASAESKQQSELSLEVAQLKAQQKILMDEYQKSQDVREQQLYLQQHRQLWLFYQALQLKLNEMLLAYKMINSGLVQAVDIKNAVEIAAEVAVRMTIELAGDSIPLPGAKLASSLILGAMAFYRKKKREKEASHISAVAVSVCALEKITEECARILAQRYEEQILQCSLAGAKMLAECGVRRILEAIRCGCVNALQNDYTHDRIVRELLANITTVDTKDGILDIKEKRIEVAYLDQKWTEAGVYKRPGLKVGDTYYTGGELRPEKYGYRLGTEEEAHKMGLRASPVRVAGAVRGRTLPHIGAKRTPLVRAQTFSPEGSEEVPVHTSAEPAPTPLATSPAPTPLATSPAATSPVKPVPTISSDASTDRLQEMEKLLDSMQKNISTLQQQFDSYAQLQAQLSALGFNLQ